MSSPMSTPRHGLAVLWDTLIDPKAAFAELCEWPHWGWAFLAICVLGMVGTFLQTPAAEHASINAMAHNPQFATMSSEQAANAKHIAITIQSFSWLFFPIIAIIAIAFAAAIYLVVKSIGKGSATFSRLFALSANVGILSFGITPLLVGAIATLRGAESFTTQADLLGVLPSLGWLVPASAGPVHVFFLAFNVFQLWSIALIALGLRAVASIGALLAWGTAIGIAIAGALVVATSVH